MKITVEKRALLMQSAEKADVGLVSWSVSAFSPKRKTIQEFRLFIYLLDLLEKGGAQLRWYRDGFRFKLYHRPLVEEDRK